MRSTDIFGELLLPELKEKIFAEHMTLRERMDFSIVNKGNRFFYIKHISKAIIHDINKALVRRGLRQVTVESFWLKWDVYTVKIAATLAMYLQDDYPGPIKKVRFIKWLCGDEVQNKVSPTFISIAVFFVLGIEMKTEEADRPIVTEKNIELAKAFLTCVYVCNEMEREGTDYDFEVEGIKDFDVDGEFAEGGITEIERAKLQQFKQTIIDFECSMRELDLVVYAEQFRKQMLLTYLQDKLSGEYVAVYNKVMQDQRFEVERYTSRVDSVIYERLREALVRYSLVYVLDRRFASSFYEFMTMLPEEALSAFLEGDIDGSKERDVAIDCWTFKTMYILLQHIEQGPNGRCIKDLLGKQNDRVKFILKFTDLYFYSNFSLLKKNLFCALKEIDKLYFNSTGIKIKPTVLCHLLCMLMQHQFNNVYARNPLCVDSLLYVVEKECQDEIFIGKIESILLCDENGDIADLMLTKFPDVYACHGDRLKKSDWNVELIEELYLKKSTKRKWEEVVTNDDNAEEPPIHIPYAANVPLWFFPLPTLASEQPEVREDVSSDEDRMEVETPRL